METLSKDVLGQFFKAFGNQDLQGLLDTFHNDVEIYAIRKSKQKEEQIYGGYKGIKGVKTFLTNLGSTFDTQSFVVDHMIGEADIAFANGSFVHKVKATGKLFTSDWALCVKVKEEKIISYQFFEDSAAFEEANGK